MEITKGWAEFNPILVAVDADAHKIANAIPLKMSFHSLALFVPEIVTALIEVFKI